MRAMPTMQPASIIETLTAKLQRFGPVSADEKNALSEALDRVDEYPPGTAFVIEGSSPSTSCLIAEGFAGRVRFLPGGERQILAFHVAGDFCDLHSFVLPKMDHAIQALTHCQVAKFPHSALVEISEKFPRLSRALWWDTAVDAAVHREWLIGLGRRTSYERIAHLYCEMFLRLKAIGRTEDGTFSLSVTQEDLGDAVGLTPVHVNRMLKQLREAGVVSVIRDKVTILSMPALRKAARFDAAYLAGRILEEDL